MSEQNDLFPVFIKLSQVETLVVGGGKVGLEKVGALLGNDPLARVLIVAKEASGELRSFIKDYPWVILEERPFRVEDLDGKHLVICATGDPYVNSVIRSAASERSLLLNVADTPDLCDFYLSSIVQKGSLKIAISTNGKSPTLAKRLKELFSDLFPDELEDVLEQLHSLRTRMKGDLPAKIRKLNEITKSLLDEDHPAE